MAIIAEEATPVAAGGDNNSNNNDAIFELIQILSIAADNGCHGRLAASSEGDDDEQRNG